MAEETTGHQDAPEQWSNRRIIFLAVVIALIFYAAFRLPPMLSYLLARAREILVVLMLSVALTYFLLPAVNRLCTVPVKLRPSAKRRIAALIAIFVFIGLIALLITVIVTPIVNEVGHVIETVTAWAQQDFARSIQGWLDSLLSRLPEEYRAQVEEQLASAGELWTAERITEVVTARIQEWGTAIVQWHANVIATVLSSGRYLIGLVIVPVFAYYFLTDAGAIRRGVEAEVPAAARKRYNQMLDDMDAVIQGYVQSLIVISAIIGLATVFILYLAGVDVYLTFGILAGVANMVPVLGAIVAVIAMAAIALLQVGLKRAVIILLVYGAVELVVDRVVAPKLMGRGSKLHPVAVIVAIPLGHEFFGLVGVFFAVPVLAAARVAWLHYRAYVSEGEASREFDRLLGRDRGSDRDAGEAGTSGEAESVVAGDADEDEADSAAMNGDTVDGDV
ncbi:MAG: AI-2E family transporter [Armatimonadota bacterium]|jgi:predicted PurR-regulated permease PerM